jgi:hypothetical protein
MLQGPGLRESWRNARDFRSAQTLARAGRAKPAPASVASRKACAGGGARPSKIAQSVLILALARAVL